MIICARDKKTPKPPKAPMRSVRTGALWDVLATGPFPITPRGNRYILVLTDLFKYVENFKSFQRHIRQLKHVVIKLLSLFLGGDVLCLY